MTVSWIVLNPQEFILAMIGLIGVVAAAIYIFFYELFQRAAGRDVKEDVSSDELRYYPVMGGWPIDSPESPPVSKIVLDILNRAWRHVSKTLSKASDSLMKDWYTYAYLLLLVFVLMSLVMRWWR